MIIDGTSLDGTTKVLFGARPARFTVVSDGEIRAVAPHGRGTVAVVVETPAGATSPELSDRFAYLARSEVLGLSPASGPATGGTTVLIHGTWFRDVTAVRFGTAATRFHVISGHEIRAVAPAGGGTVTVFVTTPAGRSPEADAAHYRDAAPAASG